MFKLRRVSSSEEDTEDIHLSQPWYSDKYQEYKFNMTSLKEKRCRTWIKTLAWDTKRQWNPDSECWVANLEYLPRIFLHMSVKYDVSMTDDLLKKFQEEYQPEIEEKDVLQVPDSEIVGVGF